MNSNYDAKCISALRVLAVDAIQAAKSGHPGLPLGAAPMAYTLYSRHLKTDPARPEWFDRDRFVLSAGHGSALMYGLLHVFGFGLTAQDISQFRQADSLTPGHPEFGHTTGIDATTGPLGQGFAMAVGMAVAERHLAARFNKPGFDVVDHNTYCLVGDGCLMEGISYEAASWAGTMGLDKLIVFYDSNNISIEGSTDIAFTEDVRARFAALGWNTDLVTDGNDIGAISAAIARAKENRGKPTLIEVKTVIGYGSPRAGMASAHGEPLGAENIAKLRETLDWDHAPFEVPQDVLDYARAQIGNNAAKADAWEALMAKYAAEYPEQAKQLKAWIAGEVDKGYLTDADFWAWEGAKATRQTSGEVLAKLMKWVPNFFGGSADLAPSTKAVLPGAGDFSAATPEGANLHFGVRELAMAAICNGVALHGGLRPFCATFFVFSDYVKPVARLSALMGLPVLYVLTHDSIGVGEDGPTHQPVEQLAGLRSIPGFTVFRPADGPETSAAYAFAMEHKGPVALALTRQNLPTLPGSGVDAMRGCYLLKAGGKNPDLVLVASGSEVHLILQAAEVLEAEGLHARVLSMPSMEVFDRQPQGYKDTLFPADLRARVAVEAGASFGWHKYVGLDGDVISVDGFGASQPADGLFVKLGFTVDNVVARAKAVVAKLQK